MLIALFPWEDFDTNLNHPLYTQLSTDNGQTWTAGTTLVGDRGAIVNWTAGIVLATNQVLVGDLHYHGDGFYTNGGIAVIDVTESPLTYFNRIPSAFANSIGGWSTRGFVKLDANTIWAFGLFPNSANDLLKSTDGGQTFQTQGSLPGDDHFQGDVRGSTLIIGGVATVDSVISPVVFRSTNGGSSFDTIALPSASYNGTARAVYTVRHLGNGVWLAGGFATRASGSWIRLWRSTDDGETWTEVTSGIADPASSGSGRVRNVLPCGNDVVVIALDTSSTFREPYRLSTDNGVTFPTKGTYSPALLSTSYAGRGLALTDDGAVIGTANVFADGREELYRGVISGSSITWTRVYNPEAPEGIDTFPTNSAMVFNTGGGTSEEPASSGMMGF